MKHAELAKFLNSAMRGFCEANQDTTPEDILTALTLSLALRCRMYGIPAEDVKANLDEIFKFTNPCEDETH
jgi:hypothetical protein